MDANAKPTLSKLLASLNDDQTSLLSLLARDYRKDEAFESLNWKPEQGREVITSLCEHLGFDDSDSDDAVEYLKTMGRQYGFLTPPTEDTQKMRQFNKRQRGEMPDLVATAKLVLRLTTDERDLLTWQASSTWGDNAKVQKAKELGVTSQTISNRLSRIYKKLNVPYAKGQKTFLKNVLIEFERQKKQIRDGTSLSPVKQKPPVDVAVSPPVDSSHEVVVTESLQMIDQKSEIPLAAIPQSSTLTTQGMGVVITLPADVSDVDVVSGYFDGKAPRSRLKEAIQERRLAGLKPGVLVLTTTTDPEVSHGQLVFFEQPDASGQS